MSCIARDGLDGMSLRDVADEADVSLGLLSYHFADRRSLIVAAFGLATDRLLATSLDSIEGVDGAEARVRTFLRSSFCPEFLEPNYIALRVALWAISRTDNQIEVVEKRFNARYLDSMADLILAARPDLSPLVAAERALDVSGMQNGLWVNWARYFDQAALNRGLDRCELVALGATNVADH